MEKEDKKMNEAYNRMTAHVDSFESFYAFYEYFLKQVKTEDKEELNKWLLKVLFIQMKKTKEVKHDFDVMVELLENQPEKAFKAKELKDWLKNALMNAKKGATK
ncbi:MAG: hypothetical protein C0625_15430 [Arcobacter sp.]|nr:MAG: hypothetical protein C0625_15430 [Arcobacter sp.]